MRGQFVGGSKSAKCEIFAKICVFYYIRLKRTLNASTTEIKRRNLSQISLRITFGFFTN